MDNDNQKQEASDNYEILWFGILEGTEHMYVNIRFTIPSMNRTTTVAIPMTDVKNKKFDEYLPEGFVLQNVSFKDQSEFLRRQINEELKIYQPQKMKVLLPQGFSNIGGRWLYTVGDYIMGKNKEDENITAYNPGGVKLFDFYVRDPEKWGEWCKLFVNSGRVPAALFLGALTPFLRPIQKNLYTSTETTVNMFIVGPTGVGKTSLAKCLTTNWDGKTAGVNLGNDSKALYNEIARYTDMSLLVDDLASTDAREEKAKRLNKLLELIQLNSAGGNIEVKHRKLEMDRLNLIITGEYTPSAAAKLNRCVLVKMDGELQPETLTKLQQNPDLYRSFAVSFINWIVVNSENLTDLIRENQENNGFIYRGAHSKASDYYGFFRIMTSYRNLMIARLLFLNFCKDSGIISEEKEFRKLAKHLELSVNDAINNTLEAVRREPESETSRVIAVLSEVFAGDPRNIVTDDVEKYAKNNKKVFLLYYNRIYFKAEIFLCYLEECYGYSLTTKALSAELNKAHLYFSEAKEKSGKIPKEITRQYADKEKCKGRHYVLSRSAVCDMVLSEYPDLLQRVNSPITVLRPDFGKK